MKAKTIIQEEIKRAGLNLRQLLLFGSRAQGRARPDSDWDFLIVVDRLPERSLRLRLETRIGVRLVQERLPADAYPSESRFDECKNDVGHTPIMQQESIVL